MTEQWRPVVGYEGFYEVSDHGRVRSVMRWCPHRYGARRVPQRILKPTYQHRGSLTPYALVQFRIDGIKGYGLVHQWVLEAFVGPRPAGHQACHWDGNASNNRADNLRWGTPLENGADRVRHGTHRGDRRRRLVPADHKQAT